MNFFHIHLANRSLYFTFSPRFVNPDIFNTNEFNKDGKPIACHLAIIVFPRLFALLIVITLILPHQ